MFKTRLIFIFLVELSSIAGFVFAELHPNTGLTPEQLIEKYGYPFENHTVQTDDGYLLTLHRIPYGVKNSNTTTKRPVALIMHGFISSSADFINTGPDRAISFLLADAGYDVWLGNFRGNKFSRKHISIDPDKENMKFFNFSCDEWGLFDLPAKIDYILNKTEQKQLFYIGHSLGATTPLMLLSAYPKYNDKIKMVSALAPVVYIKYANALIIRTVRIICPFVERLKSFEVLPNDTFLQPFLRIICTIPVLRELCIHFLFLSVGFDSVEFDREFLPVILTNSPAGSSLKQVQQYCQMDRKYEFTTYDYGPKGNLEKYGQTDSPTYNLSKITVPIIVHFSKNDYFTSFKDNGRLVKELPNVQLRQVPLSAFNHIDFMWAIDIAELLNKKIVDEIKSFT